MIEIFVIALLLVYIGWSDYNNRKERKELINRIIAKDNQELVNLELADKTKIDNEVKEPKEDLIATEDLNDDEFDKFVLNKDND